MIEYKDMCEKRVLSQAVSGEIIEKKSRFIGTLMPVKDEAEAVEFIEKTKKKYWDARHNCSAFIIGDNNELTRCSDDGEPSGTAGRPMLEVLSASGIRNVACVVTRYFGGVLLGTGGLVRAYQGAVKEALENAVASGTIKTIKKGTAYNITIEYNDFTAVQRFFMSESYPMKDILYTDKITFVGIFPMGNEEKGLTRITDITSARAVCQKISECDYEE